MTSSITSINTHRGKPKRNVKQDDLKESFEQRPKIDSQTTASVCIRTHDQFKK